MIVISNILIIIAINRDLLYLGLQFLIKLFFVFQLKPIWVPSKRTVWTSIITSWIQKTRLTISQKTPWLDCVSPSRHPHSFAIIYNMRFVFPTTDMGRATVALFIVSFFVMFIAFWTGVAGCWRRSPGNITATAILVLLACEYIRTGQETVRSGSVLERC